MADDELITAYADRMRRSLSWRDDVDDLVDELVDHLLSTAEGLRREGIDARTATAVSLGRFGPEDLVSRHFTLRLTGGTAVPTTLSRATGLLGLLAAAGFGAVLLKDLLVDPLGRSWSVAEYTTWATMIGVAVLLHTLLLLGVLLRAGDRRSAAVVTVAVSGGLALVVVAAAGWLVPVWGLLLTVGALAVHARVPHTPLALTTWPRWALLPMVWAWLATTVLIPLSQGLAIGPADAHGDHALGTTLAVGVGLVAAAVGCARLGWWLLREPEVETSSVPPLAHA